MQTLAVRHLFMPRIVQKSDSLVKTSSKKSVAGKKPVSKTGSTKKTNNTKGRKVNERERIQKKKTTSGKTPASKKDKNSSNTKASSGPKRHNRSSQSFVNLFCTNANLSDVLPGNEEEPEVELENASAEGTKKPTTAKGSVRVMKGGKTREAFCARNGIMRAQGSLVKILNKIMLAETRPLVENIYALMLPKLCKVSNAHGNSTSDNWKGSLRVSKGDITAAAKELGYDYLTV